MRSIFKKWVRSRFPDRKKGRSCVHYADQLQRLLLYIEEIENYDFWKLLTDGGRVSKVKFTFDHATYKVNTVFCNHYWGVEEGSGGYIDYHFSFLVEGVMLKLIYSTENDRYTIQCKNKKIINIFYNRHIDVIGINNFAFEVQKEEINFLVEKKRIDLGNIILKTDETPDDYFNIKRWVYFQIGGTKQGKVTQKMISDKLNKLDKTYMLQNEEYGFSFLIAMQEIPEIIKLLSPEFAIYTIQPK